MKLNVKTGDNVVVIAGKDKGKTGKVIAAYPSAGRVKVENVNVVSRHRKPRSAQVPGGIFKEPAAVDVSNVQIICSACNKATRVRHAEADGKKIRVCAKCGASLDTAKVDKKSKKAETKAAKPSRGKKKDEATAPETEAAAKPAKKTGTTAKSAKAKAAPAVKAEAEAKAETAAKAEKSAKKAPAEKAEKAEKPAAKKTTKKAPAAPAEAPAAPAETKADAPEAEA